MVQENGLTIHQDKMGAIIISPKSFIGPLQTLRLEDHYVKFVTELECLGMTVDNTLSRKAQIQRVSKTLSSKLKILKRIKYLSTPVKESSYFKGQHMCNILNIYLGHMLTRGLRTTGENTSKSSKIIHGIANTNPDTEILKEAK